MVQWTNLCSIKFQFQRQHHLFVLLLVNYQQKTTATHKLSSLSCLLYLYCTTTKWNWFVIALTGCHGKLPRGLVSKGYPRMRRLQIIMIDTMPKLSLSFIHWSIPINQHPFQNTKRRCWFYDFFSANLVLKRYHIMKK